jgi:hypothetical protein
MVSQGDFMNADGGLCVSPCGHCCPPVLEPTPTSLENFAVPRKRLHITGVSAQALPNAFDRVGFAIPGDMRVQEQGLPRQPACAAGAEALAEAEAAHAAANPAGVR